MTPLCNICGQPFNQCGHVPGREYEGVICVDPWANDAIRPRVWNADEVDGAETNAESVWQRDAIATIRDRDARIAHLEHELSERKLGEHYAGYCAAQEDMHRAEAFALYVALITKGNLSFSECASDAITGLDMFDAEWEKRNG